MLQPKEAASRWPRREWERWVLGAAAAAAYLYLYSKKRQQRITQAALAMCSHPTGSDGWTAGRQLLAIARGKRQHLRDVVPGATVKAVRACFRRLYNKTNRDAADLGVTSRRLKQLKRLDLGGGTSDR